MINPCIMNDVAPRKKKKRKKKEEEEEEASFFSRIMRVERIKRAVNSNSYA